MMCILCIIMYVLAAAHWALEVLPFVTYYIELSESVDSVIRCINTQPLEESFHQSVPTFDACTPGVLLSINVCVTTRIRLPAIISFGTVMLDRAC